MINNPILTQFRVNESAQFMTDVVTICMKKDVTTLGIKLQVAQLSKIASQLKDSLNLKQGNDLTESLITNDNRRDNAIVCFRTMALAHSKHFNVSKQEAGMNLLKAIDMFGTKVSKYNYQAETSTIDALCKRIDTDATLSAQVELLNMSEILNELKQANKLFNTIYLSRVEHEASNQVKSASELAKESQKLYHALETHINAHEVLNPSDELTLLINELNQLIEKYNITVETRSTQQEVIEQE